VNAEPGSVKEKMFQRIERAEHTKAMFLRLPSIKSKPSGGISLIKVPTNLPDKPKEAKEWRTVTEPDEIKQLIMERQKSSFWPSLSNALCERTTKINLQLDRHISRGSSRAQLRLCSIP
jgi:hypothetical protein